MRIYAIIIALFTLGAGFTATLRKVFDNLPTVNLTFTHNRYLNDFQNRLCSKFFDKCDDFKWLRDLDLVTGDQSQCPPGDWVNIEDNCFLLSTQQLSWQQAIKDCQYYSASLLQFYNSDIKNRLMQYVSSTKITTERWWTGMNDIDNPFVWVWGQRGSQETVDSGILDWLGEPSDTNHVENCGALNIVGEVSDEKCSERHGFICEYPTTNFKCEPGWQLTQTTCYYFSDFNDPYSLVSWSKAITQCNQLTSNHNATLLKLDSLIERAYISGELPTLAMTSQLWWIGMSDEAQEGHWKWTDGTDVTDKQISWANEPNNIAGQEHCVMLYNNGGLADKNCNLTARYICNTPAIAQNNVVNKFGCPYGWERAGHKCYLFQYSNKLKWSDYVDTCGKKKARPLQITSLDEKNYIQLATTRFSTYGSFWTGLNYNPTTNVWNWQTGVPANTTLIRWNSEPNDYAGKEDCAVILQDSAFNDFPCGFKQGFICELQSEDSPCAPGWLSLGDEGVYSCYYISNTTDDVIANWDEAHVKCKQLGQPMNAYLFAVNNQDELEFIYHGLQRKPKTSIGWWTGLNDRKIEGEWQYDTDFNTYKPNLIPWDSEPNNSGGKDYCACIYSGGRYNDMDCGVKNGYICETYAAGQNSEGHRIHENKWTVMFMFIVYWRLYDRDLIQI